MSMTELGSALDQCRTTLILTPEVRKDSASNNREVVSHAIIEYLQSERSELLN